VPQAIKRAIGQTRGCEVYNHYAMTEMGLGGGVDGEARRGYHLREADRYFEISDPVTDAALPDGQFGEVVFTTLTRRGMPLIRYRTGDVSRFIPEPCPCATRLKTLERITQRLNGRVPIGSRYLTMADLAEARFAIDDVLNFTATLLNDTGQACLHRAVKIADERRAQSIIQAIRAAVPASQELSVRVVVVETIPPSMAKRTILDRRNHA
jgi:phenylacetate-coenzyme A ligase PaaK-like adenylate-forming protein